MSHRAASGDPWSLPQVATPWRDSFVLGGVLFLCSAVALGLRSPEHLSSLWLSNALLLGWMLRSPAYSHRHGWTAAAIAIDRKSTRLNSSHLVISYAVFCLKKKKKKNATQ